MNKVVQVSRYSEDLSGIEVVERPIPQPATGEVLVKVHLRPINPADVFMVRGVFAQSLKPPLIPGSEGVGTVASPSSKFALGQRVVAAPWPMFYGAGSWAEYCIVSEASLVAVPDAMPDSVAAQFFINPVAVYGLLDSVPIPDGKYLLQTAAASAFGRMVISLAKARGTRTINIVRRSEQVAELKALGADEVIATDSEDVPSRVREITGGEGAEAAIDCVGGDALEAVVAALRPGGTVWVYGSLSGAHAKLKVDWFDVVALGKRVDHFLVWGWLESLDFNEREEKLDEVMGLLLDGTLAPPAGVNFPLTKVREAIAAHERPGRQGKIMLESRGKGLSRLGRTSVDVE